MYRSSAVLAFAVMVATVDAGKYYVAGRTDSAVGLSGEEWPALPGIVRYEDHKCGVH